MLKQWQINKASCPLWLVDHIYCCPKWDTFERKKDAPDRQGEIVSLDAYNGSLRIRLEMDSCNMVMIRAE